MSFESLESEERSNRIRCKFFGHKMIDTERVDSRGRREWVMTCQVCGETDYSELMPKFSERHLDDDRSEK